MKKVVLLACMAFVTFPGLAGNVSFEKPERIQTDCHAWACEMAEQGAELGLDIDYAYEVAYDFCNSW